VVERVDDQVDEREYSSSGLSANIVCRSIAR
jgi:hypothetical protein